MKMSEQDQIPQAEKMDSEPRLEEVYRILHTNAQMMCDRMGESLSFCSLYEEEQQAKIAEERLKELGLSPRREAKELFLVTQFSEEEIEAAKNYTTLIK